MHLECTIYTREGGGGRGRRLSSLAGCLLLTGNNATICRRSPPLDFLVRPLACIYSGTETKHGKLFSFLYTICHIRRWWSSLFLLLLHSITHLLLLLFPPPLWLCQPERGINIKVAFLSGSSSLIPRGTGRWVSASLPPPSLSLSLSFSTLLLVKAISKRRRKEEKA